MSFCILHIWCIRYLLVIDLDHKSRKAVAVEATLIDISGISSSSQSHLSCKRGRNAYLTNGTTGHDFGLLLDHLDQDLTCSKQSVVYIIGNGMGYNEEYRGRRAAMPLKLETFYTEQRNQFTKRGYTGTKRAMKGEFNRSRQSVQRLYTIQAKKSEAAG